MDTGSAYAFCVRCGCVAIHDGIAEGAHHWIGRRADAEERRILGGMICNVCSPRPNLLCVPCGKIGHDAGGGYVWTARTPTKRELQELHHELCPDCAAQKSATGAP